VNNRKEQQKAEREKRKHLGEALAAWKDLKIYLTALPSIEDASLKEFLNLNNRFIEAVDSVPVNSRDAFERRISSSNVALKYLQLVKASLATRSR
jgi:hypothetical protein